MSSFKRKGSALSSKHARTSLPGTRASANCPSVAYLSSGIASLDDILGGGIPLGSVLVILAPDLHSAWGTLLQRYFVAQGIILNQHVAIVSDSHDALSLVNGCMWLPASSATDGGGGTHGSNDTADDLGDEMARPEGKIEIAWRYEKMQQFQTTVATTFSSEGYRDTFELSSQIPASVVSRAFQADQLSIIEIPPAASSESTFESYLKSVKRFVAGVRGGTRRQAARLSIPDLGSPNWGDTSPRDILAFLFRLRTAIRSTDVAALVTLPAHLSAEWPRFFAAGTWNDEAVVERWRQKVSLLTDGCLLFTSFGADPSLASLFKTYHGAVRVLRSPTVHTLLPASNKHSTLRGLRASSTAGDSSKPGENASGTGENNLAFRCTRKRFIIETLHLDAEGGVGERRTSAPPTAVASLSSAPHTQHLRASPGPDAKSAIVALEETSLPAEVQVAVHQEEKPKKRVAFHFDRPELYDF